MSIIDFFKPKKPSKPQVKKPTEKSPVSNKEVSEKDQFTQRGEPWVKVIGFELDQTNLGTGAIELDYNDIFVARLVKAGYRGKDDRQIVDQWFTDVCRNIVLETFEQEQADPDKRNMINRRDLGGGRSEFS